MAVFTAVNALLRTRVQIGTNLDGRPILRSCSYNGVDHSVAADDLLAVSQAIGNVIVYPIVESQFSRSDLIV